MIVRCLGCGAIRPAAERDPEEWEALDPDELADSHTMELGGVDVYYYGFCLVCAMALDTVGTLWLYQAPGGIQDLMDDIQRRRGGA